MAGEILRRRYWNRDHPTRHPQLTVRHTETSRQPVRVVVDRNLELPLSARILEGGNVLVATAVEHAERALMLAQAGAEVLVLPMSRGRWICRV